MDNEAFNSINEYFKQIGQITKDVKREEMADLWARIRQGDAQAKNQMMEMNLRLVVPTAKRFLRSGIDLMDLIEEGNLGLMQAIEKFDSSKGYRFSTYAIYWIEQYIRKYIEEQGGAIRIPSHAWGNLKRWFKAWNTLKEENGRDPSLSEMAAELDLSAKQVKAVMDTLSLATGVESLTSLVGEDEEMTLEEVLSDDGTGNPHDVFLRSESAQMLQESLLNLAERDREILSLRFGLVDNEPKTLGEVAEKMGLSRERVRQLEERALHQLRKDALKAGFLEQQDRFFHTRNLHDNLLSKQKTNILGQVDDNTPLMRLLRRKAVQEERETARKKPAKKETPAKKKKAIKTKAKKQSKTKKKVAAVSKKSKKHK